MLGKPRPKIEQSICNQQRLKDNCLSNDKFCIWDEQRFYTKCQDCNYDILLETCFEECGACWICGHCSSNTYCDKNCKRCNYHASVTQKFRRAKYTHTTSTVY